MRSFYNKYCGYENIVSKNISYHLKASKIIYNWNIYYMQ